ncbi:MAG: CDP-alcohol phosphatidyltransferase family protein [Chloroflexota bacterium]|nr:CDP-alcohol phosphatidyltransferase family protein [Chloroflexota bacterium]
MDLLADVLTALRSVFVLTIIYTALQGPDEGFPLAAPLTILAWITDVLDGPLARRARRPTRLGRCDIVADIGLTLALATCLIAWGYCPSCPSWVDWCSPAWVRGNFMSWHRCNWRWGWSTVHLSSPPGTLRRNGDRCCREASCCFCCSTPGELGSRPQGSSTNLQESSKMLPVVDEWCLT